MQVMKKKDKKNESSIIYGIIKVGTKGQVAIPKDLRDDLDIKQGDQLLVARRPEGKGFIVVKAEMLDELVLNLNDIDIT